MSDASAAFTLSLTDTARDRLKEFLAAEECKDAAVRVVARRMGRRFRYGMDLVGEEGPEDGDKVVEDGGVRLAVDPESAENLNGTTIDFAEEDGRAGFRFDNPNAAAPSFEPGSVAARIQTLLDDEINPSIAGHGGFIDLVKFEEGVAYVFMGGGCTGCGMASQTLYQGVEVRIKEAVPEVERLEDTTHHAAGENPYM